MTITQTSPALFDYRHWVFDMDGTLTEAVHDFALIRRALDIPPEADILHHLASLPADQAAAKHAWLLEHERELARTARAAPGAVELVRALQAAGCQLGMLTRNARELAQVTLQAIGLHDAFAWDTIVGRDEAAPKPAPDGLQYFRTTLVGRRCGIGDGRRPPQRPGLRSCRRRLHGAGQHAG
ncbi:Phosphoglycolate phosphatase [Xanthomonas hydrangeae]|nr:Phosphoglycolate phosphatase [Xanthomonas hydrangeae]CAD7713766.1 Phosphoglycolate phosphatase [Xanthomonas hydrangeae]CAD7721093.1 Phosphoglycolate phosphatase [Xanthomonas hydrangeae]CAD7721097.1 Phosphoglycolate phosphatase [Xanthomonas hydrangeae]